MKTATILSTLIIITTSLGLAMSQKPKDEKKQKPTFKVTGKSIGFFQVNIEKEDNGNGDLTLIAQVMPRQNMNGAEFLWKVPKDVKVLSGNLKGTDSFEAGKVKEFRLVVSKDSMKNKDQVFFFVYKMVNGEKQGGTHSYVHNIEGNFLKSETKQPKMKKPKKIFQ